MQKIDAFLAKRPFSKSKCPKTDRNSKTAEKKTLMLIQMAMKLPKPQTPFFLFPMPWFLPGSWFCARVYSDCFVTIVEKRLLLSFLPFSLLL